MNNEKNQYIENKFNNKIIPKDLSIIIDSYFDNLNPPKKNLLKSIYCQLIIPGTDIPLISGSYLNEQDKANNDIMANVHAINHVFQYITFICETDDGDIIGYWHGPKYIDIIESPIVKFNTGGQFSLLPGSNISEALIGDLIDDDNLKKYIKAFKKAGITLKFKKYDDLVIKKYKDSPSALHYKMYNEFREKYGLEEI